MVLRTFDDDTKTTHKILHDLVQQQKMEAENILNKRIQEKGLERVLEQAFHPLTKAMEGQFNNLMKQFLDDEFETKSEDGNKIKKQTLRKVLLDKIQQGNQSLTNVLTSFVQQLDNLQQTRLSKDDIRHIIRQFVLPRGPTSSTQGLTPEMDSKAFPSSHLQFADMEFVIEEKGGPTLITLTKKKDSIESPSIHGMPIDIQQISENTIELQNERTKNIVQVSNPKVMQLLTIDPTVTPLNYKGGVPTSEDVNEFIHTLEVLNIPDLNQTLSKTRTGSNSKLKYVNTQRTRRSGSVSSSASSRSSTPPPIRRTTGSGISLHPNLNSLLDRAIALHGMRMSGNNAQKSSMNYNKYSTTY